MMYCDACNQSTPLRINIDAPARRMGVCAPCHLRYRSGEQLRPAHPHNHDRVQRRPRREVRVPEQFR